MGHGGTLKKIRNIDELGERAAAMLMALAKPIETMRTAALASAIYDDVYNYTLPTDFNDLIDLYPQDDRELWDRAFRNGAGQFDVEKAVRQKTISIEGSNGIKTIRINWRSRQPKVLNTADSLTGNGTWSAVGSAASLAADTIFKVSGSASLKFTLVASGDGIKNSTMSAVDLTDENLVAEAFVWVYFSNIPTSVSAIWGNDLTTKFWTAVAQTTQADGTAFQVGWNLLAFPWATATQTGVVDPTAIDSFQITAAVSSLPANNIVRVDNIVFAIGRPFYLKYYSKYFFMTSSGTWETRPTSGDDYVLVDNDTLPLFLFECLQEMAQQMEGTDGAFDITFAERRLASLYPRYRGRFPSLIKKQVGSYGSGPRYGASQFSRIRRSGR